MSIKSETVFTITCDRCGNKVNGDRSDTVVWLKARLGRDGWSFFTTDKAACGECMEHERRQSPGFIGELAERCVSGAEETVRMSTKSEGL